MNKELSKTYNRALEDEGFCSEMREANDCIVPFYFSSDATKIAFAAMYKGYLLAKLGAHGYNNH